MIRPEPPLMELRELAERILLTESIAEKLDPTPSEVSDQVPGPVRRMELPEPARRTCASRHGGRPPPCRGPGALRDAKKRGVAHHILANHELQALEVMAFVLLAFPAAPAEFRRGLVPHHGRRATAHAASHQARGRVGNPLRRTSREWLYLGQVATIPIAPRLPGRPAFDVRGKQSRPHARAGTILSRRGRRTEARPCCGQSTTTRSATCDSASNGCGD